MVQCGVELLDCESDSFHNSHANVETATSHIIGGYYDLQSQCVIYNPTNIENFGVFSKERKMSIAKSCKSAMQSVKTLYVMFDKYISRLPVLEFCSSNYDTVLMCMCMCVCSNYDTVLISTVS